MKTIVVKFGGSSLASAQQFEKAAAIIKADEARRYVVASAPGKRDGNDTKVTDLLYRCYTLAANGEDASETLKQIEARFQSIASALVPDFDVAGEIAAIAKKLAEKPERDYMASRGEYLNSKLLAAFLGYDFLDPAEAVRFFPDGSFDSETTNELLAKALERSERCVIAGFYGALPDGTIHTFSRGGSDVTGAIVARAVKADLYENWTDVSGMLSADPRIVEDPRTIIQLTYQELRELSYMGASVLHEDAVFPVQRANIPINIRNTNRPTDHGTMIVPVLPGQCATRKVTGVAGRTGFSSILIDKAMMNGEIGFGAKLLTILANHGVSFEHCPSGIDTMSIIVNTEALAPERDAILREIQEQLQPDHLSVEDHLALIAVVGQGMIYSKGVAASIFRAIADAKINIRMIDQGSSELNIIVAVQEADYEKAIQNIYHAVENRL